MTYWEQISRETVDGFDIVFSVAAEDTHPRDSFDMEPEELAQLCEDIDRGRYSWFVARVQAFRAGVELAADFVKAGDYYADMVDTVKREARETIAKLTEELEA